MHLKNYGGHMKEKEIEQKLVRTVKASGGIAPKFVSPGLNGMPDRVILLPNGKFAFAELKAPNRKPRPLQIARHEMLKQLGFRVYVIDDESKIKKIVLEIGGDAE